MARYANYRCDAAMHAWQPIQLNQRQAGAAIENMIRDERRTAGSRHFMRRMGRWRV
jgi:hypothetical protein